MLNITKKWKKSKGFSELRRQNEDGSVEWKEIETFVQVTKRHFKKGEFYMRTFALDELIMEADYSKSELRTLIALTRKLDFNNRIKAFRQVELAKEIKDNQSQVSKAIKRLEKDGIIFKEGHDFYFSDRFVKFAGNENARGKATTRQAKQKSVTKSVLRDRADKPSVETDEPMVDKYDMPEVF